MDIPIKIKSDEKGYFDRECPNEKCLFKFKISMADWKNKVSDEEVHCPMCGHVDTSDKWWSQEQLENIKKIASSYAMSYIQQEINKSFKKLENSTKNNKFLKVKYNPGKNITFTNNPIGQSEEWNLDIICEKCGTRYSVIGSAYFCPCCGYNSVEKVFDESLDTIEKMTNSIPKMKIVLIDEFGLDKAETMCKSMIEGSLGDIVSAFQKFAEDKFKKISIKKVQVNDFQIVEKGNALFTEIMNKGYDTWLTSNELEKMNIFFQKRHLIEHNNGLVDQKYLNKSKDYSYSLGQRIIIKETDIYELLKIIKNLTNGLKEI